jgi:hypothetical protein
MKIPNTKSWQVVLKTRKQLLISETTPGLKAVLHEMRLQRLEKKKIDQKFICQRRVEQADIENALAMKARQERKEQDCKEFRSLVVTIVQAIKLDTYFTFEEFGRWLSS